MSTLNSRRGWILAVLAGLAVIAAGYRLTVPRAKEVETLLVSPGPTERVLAVNGRIRPRLQVDVRSPVAGELVDLPLDVGDRVERGATIARVDDAPEAAAIAEAEASVQAQVAVLAQARRDLARYEALGEFSARRDVEQRRLAVEEGERELNRRRAAVAQASALRGRRLLEAPFSGVVLERLVDPGQTVGTETVIYRLADLASPQITAEVDEIYAAEIAQGTDALVNIPGRPETLQAKVLHIEPRVDPATGARDVRIALPDGVIDAPAGLTVTINFIVDKRAQAVSIPRRAIMDASLKPRVRIVGRDGAVREQDIQFTDWPAVNVIVTSGLAGGERVVLNPAAVQPGEKIRVPQ